MSDHSTHWQVGTIPQFMQEQGLVWHPDDGSTELRDIKPSGKVNPWREKRVKALQLSGIYEQLERKYSRLQCEIANTPKSEEQEERWKAARKAQARFSRRTSDVYGCGTELAFLEVLDAPQRPKELVYGNFCHAKLCPTCAWLRSRRLSKEMREVYEKLECEYAHIFLTLTVRNVPGEDLKATMDRMSEGLNRLFGYIPVKKAAVGWMRSFEVTHNLGTGEFHPHVHALITVDKSYFGAKYLKQEQWRDLWKRAMKLDYDPIVHVVKVKRGGNDALAEVCKYSVKDTDYVKPEDWELSRELVETLEIALYKRRMVSFGGVVKKLRKELGMKEEFTESEEAGTEEVPEDGKESEYVVSVYRWAFAFSQYYRTEYYANK